MPKIIGVLVSSQMATLIELQTVYGTEDAYNLLEVVSVDRYNQAKAKENANRN